MSAAPRETSKEVGASLVADAELVAAVAAGDLAALGTLYDRHRAEVRRFVLRISTQRSDVDDVVHETFLTLVRAARLYDGRPNAKPFLIGIAAQLIRQRQRSWRRRVDVLRAFGRSDEIVFGASPEDEARTAEDRRHIAAALAKLSHDKRVAFVMAEAEGMSGEEIAAALDIPVATVWTRLHHARKELRKSLDKWRQR